MAQREQPERLTYSVEEAADLLGISRAGAYEAVQRGEIPHLRIGRRILVPRSALHRLVEGAEVARGDERLHRWCARRSRVTTMTTTSP
jgi:excisionase family DNA binding protein